MISPNDMKAIKEHIAENLSINVSLNDSYEGNSRYLTVSVSVSLDGEEIDSSEDYISISS